MGQSPYTRPLADGGPGRVEHFPPGTYPPAIIATCSRRGCPSALAMPPTVDAEQKDLRLDFSGWLDGPDGYVCPCCQRADGRLRRVVFAIVAVLLVIAAVTAAAVWL